MLTDEGRVIGVWRRTLARDHVAVAVTPLAKIDRAHRAALPDAAGRFGRFLGLPARLSVVTRR